MAQPPVVHVFTVDVEEYFHVRALEPVVARKDWPRLTSRVAVGVDRLLALLDDAGAKATFFTLGWLATRQPELVRRIHDAGHEVASHGYWHRRVSTMAPNVFREDLRIARDALENATGAAVRGFRAPNFSILPRMPWAYDVLIEAGYAYDSSVFPIRRPGYGNPGAPRAPFVIRRPGGQLHEFPLATATVGGLRMPAAGGGYLRLLPFWLTHRAFRQATQRRQTATFYVHPWELDPKQPRLAVSPLTRVRHYRGLDAAEERIARLLAEFQFTSIASLLPSRGARPSRERPVRERPVHEQPELAGAR